MKRGRKPLCLAWLTGMLAGAALAAGPPSEGKDLQQPASARPAETKERIERRLASVSLLIDQSSAAKQIESSANPASLAMRDKARELLRQADLAVRAEDLSTASQLLSQASGLILEGARQAAPWQITEAKKRLDFDARMGSVKALLGAQRRLSAQKNAQGGESAARQIEMQIEQASALAAANELEQAQSVLGQAYAGVTASLEALAAGDTITRTLQFANLEQEYRYELDRGDAHLILVNALLKEKRANNPRLEGGVRKYLDLAAHLHSDGVDRAAKGDYAAAIQLQESSTLELLRAIRSFGIYVPG